MDRGGSGGDNRLMDKMAEFSHTLVAADSVTVLMVEAEAGTEMTVPEGWSVVELPWWRRLWNRLRGYKTITAWKDEPHTD